MFSPVFLNTTQEVACLVAFPGECSSLNTPQVGASTSRYSAAPHSRKLVVRRVSQGAKKWCPHPKTCPRKSFLPATCMPRRPSQLVRKGSDRALLRCASKNYYVITVLYPYRYRRHVTCVPKPNRWVRLSSNWSHTCASAGAVQYTTHSTRR